MTGDPVVGIDRGTRTVRTGSGREFGYDALRSHRTNLTMSRPQAGCIIIGDGLLSLKAAQGLQGLGVDNHVVEVALREASREVPEVAPADENRE